jgi:hypothetical protein
MAELNPREFIIDQIKKSNADGIEGSYYKRKAYLRQIVFSDIIDIIFYYISLQQDLDKIASMKPDVFYNILENTWNEWIKDKKNKSFITLDRAWHSNPGPMGGTAGSAEIYAYYHPGFYHYGDMFIFFIYPRAFVGGWEHYKDVHIKDYVLLKWKQKNNIKKIDLVFNLAEMVCQAMRKNAEK